MFPAGVTENPEPPPEAPIRGGRVRRAVYGVSNLSLSRVFSAGVTENPEPPAEAPIRRGRVWRAVYGVYRPPVVRAGSNRNRKGREDRGDHGQRQSVPEASTTRRQQHTTRYDIRVFPIFVYNFTEFSKTSIYMSEICRDIAVKYQGFVSFRE